jgi:hypothetical protein
MVVARTQYQVKVTMYKMLNSISKLKIISAIQLKSSHKKFIYDAFVESWVNMAAIDFYIIIHAFIFS